LKKKIEKSSSEASNNDSGGEDSDKESNHSKESDDEHNPKNDSTLNSMSIMQIKNLIANAIKAHLKGGSHRIHHYSKPYTKRIDAMHMFHGFQPPKFHQFDGKGNPKHYMAHFIKTCNNVGTGRNLLVMQFVCSLKDLAFH